MRTLVAVGLVTTGAGTSRSGSAHPFSSIHSRADSGRCRRWNSPSSEESACMGDVESRRDRIRRKLRDLLRRSNLGGTKRGLAHGYVFTQCWKEERGKRKDFGVMDTFSARRGEDHRKLDSRILATPAPMAYYWLSAWFRDSCPSFSTILTQDQKCKEYSADPIGLFPMRRRVWFPNSSYCMRLTRPFGKVITTGNWS